MLLLYLLYLVIGVVLYVLPGYVLVGGLFPAVRRVERLGLAVAAGAALYPPLYLWGWAAGVRVETVIMWLPGGVALGVLLWQWHRRRSHAAQEVVLSRQTGTVHSPSAYTGEDWRLVATLVGILAAIGFTRWWAVREMVAPAWGDSVHHSLIVQLMREHGGLFQSWQPYAPLETLTYHFGMHANLSAWATATGLPTAQAVLSGGQIFNVLAVLALYPLAYRLSGGNGWVGAAAVGVAGLLASMPGYYANWGRYTQLGAQVILPGLLWGFDRLWGEWRKREFYENKEQAHRTQLPRTALFIGLLACGLVLTHYRVAMVGAAAGLAWAVWGLWTARRRPGRWTQNTLWGVVAALGATLLAAPWLLRLGAGRLTVVAGAMSAPAASQTATNELVIWTGIDGFYPWWMLILAGAALLITLWAVPRLGSPLALWALFAFLAANPALVGLRGSGLVSNFLLTIGLYVLFAAPLGWVIWRIGDWIWHLNRRSRPVWVGAYAVVLVGGMLWGGVQQATIVDPTNELVTPEDLIVLAWIEQNVAQDAFFLANSFLAYNGTVIVGSDAGWWLPFYTKRAVSAPPMTYSMERMTDEADRMQLRQLVLDVEFSDGEPAALQAALCRHAVTHLFQGRRQATAALPYEQLVAETWLTPQAGFTLLMRAGDAAVWEFDRTHCHSGDAQDIP